MKIIFDYIIEKHDRQECLSYRRFLVGQTFLSDNVSNIVGQTFLSDLKNFYYI